MDKFKIEISKIANIEVCKVGTVFTLLLTGENLASWKKVSQIQSLLNKYVLKDYPTTEVFKNDDKFAIVVLKK